MAARPRMAAARSRARTPTKVDRSAAYAARYLAKNVVAAGLADRCTIQLAYAIGVAEPLSVYVDTHGTGKVDEAKLEKILPQMMSLKPRGIREHLDLNKPIYRPHLRLRPFRPRAGQRGRLFLGKDRPGGSDQVGADLISGFEQCSSRRPASAGRRLCFKSPHESADRKSRGTPTGIAAICMAAAKVRSCRPGRRGFARTLLGELAYDPARDPFSQFPNTVQELWLEVGFGAGEHLVWQARAHPDIGLIGAEPYEMGVAKILTKLDE